MPKLAAIALEHPVCGQQAQRTIKHVAVRPATRGQHRRTDRLVADLVRHPQLGHDMQAPGRDTAGGQRPHNLMRLLGHRCALTHASLRPWHLGQIHTPSNGDRATTVV